MPMRGAGKKARRNAAGAKELAAVEAASSCASSAAQRCTLTWPFLALHPSPLLARPPEHGLGLRLARLLQHRLTNVLHTCSGCLAVTGLIMMAVGSIMRVCTDERQLGSLAGLDGLLGLLARIRRFREAVLIRLGAFWHSSRCLCLDPRS